MDSEDPRAARMPGASRRRHSTATLRPARFIPFHLAEHPQASSWCSSLHASLTQEAVPRSGRRQAARSSTASWKQEGVLRRAESSRKAAQGERCRGSAPGTEGRDVPATWGAVGRCSGSKTVLFFEAGCPGGKGPEYFASSSAEAVLIRSRPPPCEAPGGPKPSPASSKSNSHKNTRKQWGSGPCYL